MNTAHKNLLFLTIYLASRLQKLFKSWNIYISTHEICSILMALNWPHLVIQIFITFKVKLPTDSFNHTLESDGESLVEQAGFSINTRCLTLYSAF